jgi:rubrerythrin
MNATESPGEILDALKEHELAIAGLYEVYAEVFSDWKDFWIGLANDEREHADWIAALGAEVASGAESFVGGRFRVQAVEHSIGYVRQLAAAASEPDLILINALSIALQLERGLLEKKYFKVFAGDSAETKKALALLTEGTRTHYEKLHKFWKDNGGG